jgi:hypothetical protein
LSLDFYGHYTLTYATFKHPHGCNDRKFEMYRMLHCNEWLGGKNITLEPKFQKIFQVFYNMTTTPEV